MGVAETFIDAVNKLTPDLSNLFDGSKSYSLEDWKIQQRLLVGGSGAAAVAIPGLHLAGLAADVVFIINRMGVSAYGTGAITASEAGHGNVLEQEDFAAVLAYWAGDEAFKDSVKEAVQGKGAADLSNKVLLKLATKGVAKTGMKFGATQITPVLSQVMLSSSGYLIGQKLGGKGLAMAASKFSGKFLGKGLSGFVPFLGPVVGGGINIWLISGIIDSAEEFYKDKLALAASLS